jgi:D-alanine-D-alanine ligase-like ATP-grasp enzyme
MDIMKLQNSSVNIVMLNVKLVKEKKLTVLSVLVSEKVLQTVFVHMDTTPMKTVFVNNVVQNVPLVKFLPLTVLNVLLKDNQVLKTLPLFLAHVSMVSSKRMTIVTNVDTNVSLVKEAKMNV